MPRLHRGCPRRHRYGAPCPAQRHQICDPGRDPPARRQLRRPGDPSTPGQDAFFSRIAISPDGTATAVWYASNGSNDIIQAAIRPPGGSFGPPVDLSVTGEDARFPEVAAATDGTVTVVWEREEASGKIIQTVTRPPGGIFGAPVNLSATGQEAESPQIAIAADGTATAVWSAWDGSMYTVQASTRPPGGVFGSPEDLSFADQSAKYPQIATAPDGTAMAVFGSNDGSDDITQAATRPPGGSFGAPVDLSAIGGDTRPASSRIAIAQDGTAHSVWSRWNGSNYIIQSISTAQPSLLLGVAKNGSGKGTVTSSPAGIDCGDDCAGEDFVHEGHSDRHARFGQRLPGLGGSLRRGGRQHLRANHA